MKVRSKFTLLVTTALLVSSTVCAYALFAPSVQPMFPTTHRLNESVTPAIHQAIMEKAPATQVSVPQARPLSVEAAGSRFIDSAA